MSGDLNAQTHFHATRRHRAAIVGDLNDDGSLAILTDEQFSITCGCGDESPSSSANAPTPMTDSPAPSSTVQPAASTISPVAPSPTAQPAASPISRGLPPPVTSPTSPTSQPVFSLAPPAPPVASPTAPVTAEPASTPAPSPVRV